ncbi:MAG: hypothetical protein AB8G18_12275 [Gammaproteobacteria bacterium]
MRHLSLALLTLFWSVSASSLTLDEYGVSLTDNGLVDNVTGLRWLDSLLTQGGHAELQSLLDAGWRFADEDEFFFLLTHGSGSATLLGEDGLLQMADRLSFEFDNDNLFSGPWVCRSYSDPEQFCTTLNTPGSIAGLGVQFTLSLGDEFQEGGDTLTPVIMSPYITEVPFYGSLACYEEPDLPCIGEGRSLMVRAVPLPASFFLFSGALALLGLQRKFS